MRIELYAVILFAVALVAAPARAEFYNDGSQEVDIVGETWHSPELRTGRP